MPSRVERVRLKGIWGMKISLIGMGRVGASLAYTLSVQVDGFLGIDEVCLSLPVVVGQNGISRVLHPALGDDEAAAFRRCAEVVRQAIDLSLA